jgi:hypothetical protein
VQPDSLSLASLFPELRTSVVAFQVLRGRRKGPVRCSEVKHKLVCMNERAGGRLHLQTATTRRATLTPKARQRSETCAPAWVCWGCTTCMPQAESCVIWGVKCKQCTSPLIV